VNRNSRICCLIVLVIMALGGCSSQPSAKESQKNAASPDRIQGRAQVVVQAFGSPDASLNSGGPSVFLWEGIRRYSLYFKTPIDLVDGKEYVAEGVDAQKVIDDIGDPDQGKNGYPLLASCDRVVRMAWKGLAFDAIDGRTTLLRARVNRYPARPVFLVTEIRPATSDEIAEAKKGAPAEDKDIPEVAVAAEKQSASRIEGPTTMTAPLWEPAGGTVRCKVVINTEGKIAELATGMQLCEAVPWSKFRYQPPVKAGHPVKVSTEVEVSFEPRK
jgi:hypothetical protein